MRIKRYNKVLGTILLGLYKYRHAHSQELHPPCSDAYPIYLVSYSDSQQPRLRILVSLVRSKPYDPVSTGIRSDSQRDLTRLQ